MPPAWTMRARCSTKSSATSSSPWSAAISATLSKSPLTMALVNNDSSKLYLMIIRCSTACYRARSAELGTIATSFTVRSE